MPTSLTHQILAEEVYNSLPRELYDNVSSLAHYYLGAQGADICFTCPPFGKRQNLGHTLHKRSSLLFFRILRQEAKKDPLVRSYAYGYISHYAADTVFHPFVQAETGDGKSMLHHSIEHAYDGVFLEVYRGKGLLDYDLPNLVPALGKGVYNVYRRYALACGYGELSYEKFLWSGKAYLTATKFRLPRYKKERAKRAQELFDKAFERSLRLMKAFEKGRVEEWNFGKRLSDGSESVRAEENGIPMIQKKEEKN